MAASLRLLFSTTDSARRPEPGPGNHFIPQNAPGWTKPQVLKEPVTQRNNPSDIFKNRQPY